MRIKCPECRSVLSLGHPKPGRYRPECKHCQQTFLLEVSNDEPPRFKVLQPSAADIEATMNASVETDATTDFSVVAREKTGLVPRAADNSRGKNRVTPPAAGLKIVGAKPAVPATPPVLAEAGQDASELTDVPQTLGGYRILRLLGRGAMGAVYEAKQISLDRLVALKTIRGRLACNASSLARFTREAYAAAQLTHHNVVQIYDFGEDDGRQFFSMEWVRGGPLSDLVREKGVIDPRLAAGYTLQAARGLQFAHRNGMVHRDVKPANLLLSEDGVVKVADLGLVKIPDQIDPDSDVTAHLQSGLQSGTEVTLQGTAVGTPAYMAPEQSIDAASVDHRADIYSLGCSLFFLLAGRPPFDGTVASDVMQRHASEPLPNIAQFNRRVPDALQQIVQTSTAKQPEDRYYSLAEMIEDLESFLGVNSDGAFSPTESQADQWETLAAKYSAATRLRRVIKPLSVTLATIAVAVTMATPFLGLQWVLLGPSLFATATGISILLNAAGGNSPVVDRLRSWIGSLTWFDLGVAAVGAGVLLLVTLIAGLAIGLVVGAVLGVGLAFAYHFCVTVTVHEKSGAVIEQAERFIRNLRIGGAEEDGIREFAARYGGNRWKDLFEAVFGYDALCKVRRQLGSDPSFSLSLGRITLRDKVCQALAGRTENNRRARDHHRLVRIEQQGLRSEGMSEEEACERAWQMATALMDGVKIRSSGGDADVAAAAKRARIKAMLADARSGRYAKKRDRLSVARFALGGQTRLLAGCLLLVIFAIWTQQTGLLGQVTTIAESAATAGDIDAGAVDRLKESAATVDSDSGKNWSIGVAGILLAMSAFVSGWRMTMFAVPATIVILFGPALGVPGIESASFGEILRPWMVSVVIGLVIYVPGIIFGETREY
jgi:serine/threonine protein kinase